MDKNFLVRANRQAIYNLYIYLSYKVTPAENETLLSIVDNLAAHLESHPDEWEDDERNCLQIMRNAVLSDSLLATSRIRNLTRSKNGMNACVFVDEKGAVSVIFRGTADGEWVDNGDGLSGAPRSNTYESYDKNGMVAYEQVLREDYATRQQAEAINWFSQVAAVNGWNEKTDITVSGHSKGGNKAQVVAISSPLVRRAFSFDGQGFSPEALQYFSVRYGESYKKQRNNIYSLSASNDFVNVLGERLMPPRNIFYFNSTFNFHSLESILTSGGALKPQTSQGELSHYIERMSKEIFDISPSFRKYATSTIMGLFQKYIAKADAVGGEVLTPQKMIFGIAVVVTPLIKRLRAKSQER